MPLYKLSGVFFNTNTFDTFAITLCYLNACDEREGKQHRRVWVKYNLQKHCLWFYIISIKSCLSKALINNALDVYDFQQ